MYILIKITVICFKFSFNSRSYTLTFSPALDNDNYWLLKILFEFKLYHFTSHFNSDSISNRCYQLVKRTSKIIFWIWCNTSNFIFIVWFNCQSWKKGLNLITNRLYIINIFTILVQFHDHRQNLLHPWNLLVAGKLFCHFFHFGLI